MNNADFYTTPSGHVLTARAYIMARYRAAMIARFQKQSVTLAPLPSHRWTPTEGNGGAAAEVSA